jgi:hypothetical protein
MEALTETKKQEPKIPEEDRESNFEFLVKNLTKGTYDNAYLKLFASSSFSEPSYQEYIEFFRKNAVYSFTKTLIYDATYQLESIYVEGKEKPIRSRIFSTPFMRNFQVDIRYKYLRTIFSFFEAMTKNHTGDSYTYPSRADLNTQQLMEFNEDEDIILYSILSQIHKNFPLANSQQKNCFKFVNTFSSKFGLGPWLSFQDLPSKENELHLTRYLDKYSDLYKWRNHVGFFVPTWLYQYGLIKTKPVEGFSVTMLENFNKILNKYYSICSDKYTHCLKVLIDFFNSSEFSEENLNKVYDLITKVYATKKISEKQEAEYQWRSMLDIVLLIAADYHKIVQKPPVDRTANEKTFSDYYLKSNISKVVERVSIFRRDVLKVVG